MFRISAALMAGALAVSPAMAATIASTNWNAASGPAIVGSELSTVTFSEFSFAPGTFDTSLNHWAIPGSISSGTGLTLSGDGVIAIGPDGVSSYHAVPMGSDARPAPEGVGADGRYLSVPLNLDDAPTSSPNNSVTLSFADSSGAYSFGGAGIGAVRGFDFYWGSVDRENTLIVLTSKNPYMFSFGGAGVSDGVNFADWTSDEANRRVYVFLDPDETLQTITFASGNMAYELDTLRFTGIAAVPEPSTWAMLILGLGGIGQAMRSRRKLKPAMAVA